MMTWDEYLKDSLAASAERAAAYLRVALEEVEEDPEGLPRAINQIVEARGGLDDLGLSQAELLALVYALTRRVEQLPQAA